MKQTQRTQASSIFDVMLDSSVPMERVADLLLDIMGYPKAQIVSSSMSQSVSTNMNSIVHSNSVKTREKA